MTDMGINGRGFLEAIIVFGIIAGIIGWGAIELLLWLVSKITLVWG